MAEVIWTDPALSDLDAIADYLALDNPEAAENFVQKAKKGLMFGMNPSQYEKSLVTLGDMAFPKREFLGELPEWYWGAVSGYVISLK